MPTKTCEIDLIVHSVKTKIKLLGTKTTGPHYVTNMAPLGYTSGEQTFCPGSQPPLVPIFEPGSGGRDKRSQTFSPESNNRD